MTTSADKSWLSSYDWRQFAARGLEFRGTCPECGDLFGRADYPGWKLYNCCDKVLTEPPQPTAEDVAAYEEHYAMVDEQYSQHLERQTQKSGAGDWGKGHDIFQLPHDCPDRVVHSQAELKAVYTKYGIDADSHRFHKGQGPASPNSRRRGGSLELDNHDRDQGY